MKKSLATVLLILTAVVSLCFAAHAEPDAVCGLPVSADTRILDFDAAGINMTDAGALSEALDRYPEIEEVRMYDSTLPQTDMERLFDGYPEVFFGFTLRLAVHEIRTDTTAFSTLHYSSPTKDDPRHSSEELYMLRMCTKLKALDIGHNNLTDLNFLYYMPDLEVLIISPNYGLADISPIAACPKLVYLECFNCPITDLSPLAGLKDLRDLNLTRCTQVTDLSPLYDLPKLERFWWGHMDKVPNDQRILLREKHPDCLFKVSYDPTGEGWRNHPHYKEQFDFFRTGVYVPFAE